MPLPGRENYGDRNRPFYSTALRVGVATLALVGTLAYLTRGHPSKAPHEFASQMSAAAQPTLSSAACNTRSTRPINTENKIANAISNNLPSGGFVISSEILSTMQATAGNQYISSPDEPLQKGTPVYISDRTLCTNAINEANKMHLRFVIEPTTSPSPAP